MNWTPEELDWLREKAGQHRGVLFPSLTKRELALRVGISEQTLYAMYRGEPIGSEVSNKLAEYAAKYL